MKIHLKYFGMIAEALAKQDEVIILDSSKTITELKNQLEKTYPKLNTIDYRIAVNQTLVELNYKIETDSEIALLPPFAGG